MNGPDGGASLRLWAALGRAFAAWMRRVRDRQALAQLTARERRDMGLARCAVDAELRRPFWRA
jgi:uncharacterized protein YjiS (DUF1127 family)